MRKNVNYVVTISADAEWNAVEEYFPNRKIFTSPFGNWFPFSYTLNRSTEVRVIYFNAGWGKVSAAASTQYLIDRWAPKLIINLGTCGGFEGAIKRGEIILATKTIIYDIFELMGDPEEHLVHYATEINNSWIGSNPPILVNPALLLSADHDLFVMDIKELHLKYGAVAGDWESGAIAWVAKKNTTNCLILRGVTDIVGEDRGEAYDGNISFFYENTKIVMRVLLDSVPNWLSIYNQRLEIS